MRGWKREKRFLKEKVSKFKEKAKGAWDKWKLWMGNEKKDGFKRERENEMNEGVGREWEQMSVLKGKRKKMKEGSQESAWRRKRKKCWVGKGKRERRLGVKY